MSQRDIKVNLLFGADTSLALQNIQQLGTLLNTLTSKTQIGFETGSIKQAVSDVQQLQMHLQNAVNVNTGKLDLSKFNTSLKMSKTSLAQYSNSLLQLGPTGQQAFARLATAISQAEAPMYRLSAKTKEFMTTIANTAKWQVASTAIHGISGAFSEAIGYVEKFDKALTDIRIVSDINDEQLLNFSKRTREIAKEVNSTALDVAKGSAIYFQQGLSEKEVAERVAVTAKMANITGEQTATVASQLTAIWNNFDDGKQSLEAYADVLSYLGAKTAADTNQIATAMEKFAASAKTVGLSYEYASTAVAEIIDRTQMAPEEVGTAFKTILSRMQDLKLGESLEDGIDLSKYSKALKTVGVEVLDMNGGLKDADIILKELGAKWITLESAEKKALATTVAGVRQQTQFIALMEEWEDIEASVENLANSTGYLTKANDKYADSVEGIKEKYENIKNQFFQSLMGADNADDALKNFYKSMIGLIEQVDKFIDSFGGLKKMALTFVLLFSKQLMPHVLNFTRNVTNNLATMFGFSERGIRKMQDEFAKLTKQNLDSGVIDPLLEQQLQLSEKLMFTKQKIQDAVKYQGKFEQDIANYQIQQFEAAVSMLEKDIERQRVLEKQVQLQKELLISTSRNDIGTAVAVNKFDQQAKESGMSQEERDAIVETATTRSSADILSEINGLSTSDSNISEKEKRKTDLLEKKERLKQNQEVYETQLAFAYTDFDEKKETDKLLKENKTETADGTFAVATSGTAKIQQEEKLKATKEEIATIEQEILQLDKEIAKAEEDNEGNKKQVEMLEKSLELKREINNESRNASEKSVINSRDEMYDNDQSDERAMGNKIFNAQMKDSGVKIDETVSSEGAYEDTLHVESNIANMSQLAEKRGELTAQIQVMNSMEKDLEKTLQKATKATKSGTKETEKATKATKSGAKETEKATKAMQKKSNSLGKLFSAFKKTTNEESKMSKETEQARKQAISFGEEIKQMTKKLLQVEDGAKELNDIEEALKKLKNGNPTEVTAALETLQNKLKQLKAGATDASNTIDLASEMIKQDLSAVGLSGVTLDQLENALKQLGLYSEEARLQFEQLRQTLDTAKPPVTDFASEFAKVTTGVTSFIGKVSSGLSGIQMFMQAFDEGNTPLETTITLLSSLGMILPMVSAAVSFFTGVKKLSEEADISFGKALLAKIAGMTKEEAQTWANTGANIANLLSSPWTWAFAIAAIAAIGVTVAAIMKNTKATEDNTKANQELSNQQSDTLEKQQDVIDSWNEASRVMDDLIGKYNQLKKAGEDYSDTLTDIKNQMPDTIKAYREFINNADFLDKDTLQQINQYLDIMENAEAANDPDMFIETKEQVDQIVIPKAANNAQQLLESKFSDFKLEYEDRENQWLTSEGNGGLYIKEYTGVESHDDASVENAKLENEIFKKIMESDAGYSYQEDEGQRVQAVYESLIADFPVYKQQAAFKYFDFSSVESVQEVIKDLTALKKELEQDYDVQTLSNSDAYRQLTSFLEDLQTNFEPVLEAQKETFKWADQKIASDMAQEEGYGNISEIDSYDKYEKYKEEYLTRVEEKTGGDSAAKQTAEDWLNAHTNLEKYVNLEKQMNYVNNDSPLFKDQSYTDADGNSIEAGEFLKNYFNNLSLGDQELFGELELSKLKELTEDELNKALRMLSIDKIGITAEQYDIDPETAKAVAEGFIEQANAGDEAKQVLLQSNEALEDATIRYARLQKAVLDLAENWEDYTKVLKKVQAADATAMEKREALATETGKAFKTTLSNILNISEELIDVDLVAAIKEEDLIEAANGSEAAIKRIRDAFIDLQFKTANEILIQVNKNISDEELASFKSMIDSLAEGATFDIDDSPFLQKMIQAKIAAGASATEIEAMLSGFNIDADVTPLTEEDLPAAKEAAAETGTAIVEDLTIGTDIDQVTAENTEKSEREGFVEQFEQGKTNTFSSYVTEAMGEDGSTTTKEITSSYPQIIKNIIPTPSTPIVTKSLATGAQMVAKTLSGKGGKPVGYKFTNTRKSTGSSVSSGNTGRRAAPSGGSGSKGGGGSPSSSKSSYKPKPRKQQPEYVKDTELKKLDKETERYYVINNTLDDMQRKLDKISEAKDKAFGQNKLNLIQDEIDAQKDLISANEEYLQQIKANRTLDREALAKYGAQFDANGNLLNYADLMKTAVDKWNRNAQNFDNQQRAFNQDTVDRDYAKAVEEDNLPEDDDGRLQEEIDIRYEKLEYAAEEAQRNLDQAREDSDEEYDDFIEILDQWKETNNLYKDTIEEIETLRAELSEKVISFIDTRLEIRLEFSDNAKQLFETLMESTGEDWRTANKNSEYLNQTATEAVQSVSYFSDYLAELESLYMRGDIGYDDFLTKLTENIGAGLDAYSELQSQTDEMLEYYPNFLGSVTDAFSEYFDTIDAGSEKLSKFYDFLELTGESKWGTDYYDKINTVLAGQLKNIDARMEVSGAQLKLFQKEFNDIDAVYQGIMKEDPNKQVGQGDTYFDMLVEKRKAALAKMQEAESQYFNDTQTKLDLATTQLENALAEQKRLLELNIFDGLSSDDYLAEIDRLSARQEEYLTNTNKLYETNKLIRKAQQDMDKTDNARAKQQYNEYVKYIEQLQESGQLSAYELSIAQAKYDVLQAQIALEEAQDAKSTVRLSRDAEGNFGYVYTANEDAIENAEQALEDAENKLYNTGLDGAKEYQSKYTQTMQEMVNALAEVDANELLSTEEKQKRKAELTDHYYELLEQYSSLYYLAHDVLVENSATQEADYVLKGIDGMGDYESAVNSYLANTTEDWSAYDEVVDSAIYDENIGLDQLKNNTYNVNKESELLADEVTDHLVPALEKQLEQVRYNTSEWALENAAMKENIELMQKIQRLQGSYVKTARDITEASTNEEFISIISDIYNAQGEYSYLGEAGMDKQRIQALDSAIETWGNTMGWNNINIAQYKKDAEASGDWLTAYAMDYAHEYKIENSIDDYATEIRIALFDWGMSLDSEYVQKLLAARQKKIDSNPDLAKIAQSNDDLIKTLIAEGAMYSTSNQAQTNNVSNNTARDGFSEWKAGLTEDQLKTATEQATSGLFNRIQNVITLTPEQLNEFLLKIYNKEITPWPQFDTGGYTGEWGPEGKFAMLHQKELVLNAGDTENFLTAIGMAKEIAKLITDNAVYAGLKFQDLTAASIESTADKILQQQVQIDATFPNVTDHNEIEIAIDNLINSASQKAFS